MSGPVIAALVLAALVLGPGRAFAQADVLPGTERPELPPFEEEGPAEEPLALPPLRTLEPQARDEQRLAAGLQVLVRAFRVEGSTVFPADELRALTAPWSGRVLTAEDLVRVRDAITHHYVEHGYLTSGAVIPDQAVEDGVVVLEVVEGRLAKIEVSGTERFREGYFRTRLRRAGRAPVNALQLEAQLQRFQRDPRVRRVRAQLEPGERRGESVLRLEVEENRFYALGLGFSNESSPALGSYTGTVAPLLSNLLGWGDEWGGELELADGLTEADAFVSLPLPPFDTRLGAHFQYSENQVVEDPFDVLEIENESTTWGVSLVQPLLRSELGAVELGVTGEYRTSETRLLDGCFVFPGTGDCDAEIAVVRTFADWLLATRRNVVAARSTFSVGVDALGASVYDDDVADGEFFAWLGQVQWAHRLPQRLLGSELLVRADAQLANDPLVGIEKFAVGGLRTVRGYRENQLVRDNGVVASVELRVPVWRDARERPVVELAPFFDWGRSWDDGAGPDLTSDADTLSSVGVGIRVAPREWLRGELYWGHAFEDVPDVDGDLQDDGIHFEVTLQAL